MAGKKKIKEGKKDLLTSEEVLHVARLARLDLTPDEVALFQGQLSEILQYVGQLQAVDTSGVPETSQVTGLTNVTREDAPDLHSCLALKDVLLNAPQKESDFIKVKPIMRAK